MGKHASGFSVYKAIRLVIVVGLIAVIVLMLRKPQAPAPPVAPQKIAENAQQFNAKLQQLQSAAEHGESGTEVAFSSDEVNSFIADATVRAAQQPQPASQSAPPEQSTSQSTPPSAQPSMDAAAIEEVRAAIKKTQLAFEGDEVVTQAVVQRYGQDIYVTVRGRIAAQNGYLVFTPTGFKIGTLVVPVSMVNDTLQKKLAEPENREKLKLPDFISDIRIQNGELKLVRK